MPRLIYLSVSRIHRNMANLIQTLHTVAAIQRLGIDITLYLPPKKSKIKLSKRLEEIGINQKIKIKFTTFLHSRWKKINYFPFIFLYKRLLKSNLIYLRSPFLSLSLIKYNIPHFLEIHNVKELIEKRWIADIISAQRKKIIKHLFPISISAAKTIINLGADPKRLTVVPSGADLSLFEGIKPLNLNNLKNMPKMFYIGRISISRGLKILEKIARSNIGEVHLVGETDEPIIPHPLIKYHGFVNHKDIPKYYEQSDIILMPYQRQLYHIDSISPLKLFEAIAAGRPVIASDIPPIREILTHEKNALLVDPEDESEWIKAIKRLKRETILTQKIIEASRQIVQKFSWDERAKKIINVLSSELIR